MAIYQELWDGTETLYDAFRAARGEAQLAGNRRIDGLLTDCLNDLEEVEARLEGEGAHRHCIEPGCTCESEDEHQV